MERKFNTKLTEIKNIGDELRFQREYYNFKNSSKKITPKIYKGRNSIYLGDKLKEFLNENFEYMQEERYETDGVRTPTILLVQKGEVIDMNLSTISLNELVELLQKYMTIEE